MSFLGTFAACVVPALIAGFIGSDIVILLPLVWAGLFLIGAVVAITGRRQVGLGMVLGSLVGAFVGFSVCAGMLL